MATFSGKPGVDGILCFPTLVSEDLRAKESYQPLPEKRFDIPTSTTRRIAS
jgi:hypothetical protein